jgi:transcriptional regulator with XRE-family HTH domain
MFVAEEATLMIGVPKGRMQFARRLGQLRSARGLTQLELGERVGLTFTYISRLENGRVAPSIALLERLARGLEVEVYQFFLGARTEPQTPKIWAQGAQERFLLRVFRELPGDDRSMLLFMARKLASPTSE